MNELINNIAMLVADLEVVANKLFASLEGREANSIFIESAEKYRKSLESFKSAITSDLPEDKILNSAKDVGVYAESLKSTYPKIKELSISEEDMLNRVHQIGKSIHQQVKDRPKTFSLRDAAQKNFGIGSLQQAARDDRDISKIAKEIQDYERRNDEISLSISENKVRLEKTEAILRDLEEKVSREVSSAESLIAEASQYVDRKKGEIDNLLGIISAETVSGSYSISSDRERKAADWLRNGSIACMVVIILIVGYSAWISTSQDFKWEVSFFRLVLAFLLTIPAAYLARESSKHREKQYSYLQTSLHLKALDPYIASLPIDLQHKIKSDTASKVFASQELGAGEAGSFPINIQEIIMELIKRMESK